MAKKVFFILCQLFVWLGFFLAVYFATGGEIKLARMSVLVELTSFVGAIALHDKNEDYSDVMAGFFPAIASFLFLLHF